MSNDKILIVEDDKSLRNALKETIALEGYEVLSAENGLGALDMLAHHNIAVLVTDVQMDEMDGLTLVKEVKKTYPKIPCILMTAYGNVLDAVKAMQLGAVDYITKPFEPDHLIAKLKIIKKGITTSTDLNPIAVDEKSITILKTTQKVATTNATVLISGESGTGKEVLAQYIHQQSNRHDGPFVAINCAAIPENMLEATLFGYEKGAFTGAYKATAGKFEDAQGGTLLLDEISEMDLSLQAKLLRVLQEKEVQRLGSKKTLSLNVRIIATTNRKLFADVKSGRFREDLYYRLNVFPLSWLPLRQRTDDILPLADHLIAKHCNILEMEIPTLSEKAKEYLISYNWPGNIRELENTIQRGLIMKTGDEIEYENLITESLENEASLELAQPHATSTLDGNLKSTEYQVILDALNKCDGKRKDVADLLGISQRTLRYKLAKMREEGISINE